jgi:hypothetical protein
MSDFNLPSSFLLCADLKIEDFMFPNPDWIYVLCPHKELKLIIFTKLNSANRKTVVV